MNTVKSFNFRVNAWFKGRVSLQVISVSLSDGKFMYSCMSIFVRTSLSFRSCKDMLSGCHFGLDLQRAV